MLVASRAFLSSLPNRIIDQFLSLARCRRVHGFFTWTRQNRTGEVGRKGPAPA